MAQRILFVTVLVILWLLPGKTWAVPAYPYKVVVATADGKTAEIFMQGDENYKFATTVDGFTLLSDASGWWYATTDAEGSVVKSDFPLMAADDETDALRVFKASCPKGLLPTISNATAGSRGMTENRAAAHSPITGERRALVVLMQFRDLTFKKTNAEFTRLFNDIDYHENNATGSVRDFYRYASEGQLDYVSDIYGPYTAKNDMNYYGANTANGGNDAHAVELCVEAMCSLPHDIDYSAYDNNGDGLIDNVHIIFAGYGEEAGGPANAIWSHEYPHRISLRNEIGYSLAGYSCSPELRGNTGERISRIGVVCHELGHALGAMDYYDTNYDTGGSYEGTGKWDIMASGSWNDDGRTPPNFNPYVRSEVFGWNEQILLDVEETVSIAVAASAADTPTAVYRINTGSDGDYFLLENRQQEGFDAALPGKGLMVYHVHPKLSRYLGTNTINASHPQTFYPVCAAGSNPNDKQYGNINSAGCPFPGSKSVRTFTPTSSPAALAWNGSAANVSLTSITQAADGNILISTKPGADIPPDDPEPPVDTLKSLAYLESFETNISESMVVTSIAGPNQWRTYKKGNLTMNPEYIPEPTNGLRLLMLYSGKNNTTCESELATTNISVEAGKEYTLSFDVYTCILSVPIAPTLELYIKDKYGEHKLYELNNVTDKWTTVEIPLVFADEEFQYKLYGLIHSGGIFIDNIRLFKEETVAADIDTAIKKSPSSVLYSLTGVRLNNRGKGLVIVRRGDGHFYKHVIRH